MEHQVHKEQLEMRAPLETLDQPGRVEGRALRVRMEWRVIGDSREQRVQVALLVRPVSRASKATKASLEIMEHRELSAALEQLARRVRLEPLDFVESLEQQEQRARPDIPVYRESAERPEFPVSQDS